MNIEEKLNNLKGVSENLHVAIRVMSCEEYSPVEFEEIVSSINFLTQFKADIDRQIAVIESPTQPDGY